MTGSGAGRVYTPGVGQRDIATGQSRFALTDALGGSRALLGPDRSPLDDQRYDAFSATIYHGGGSPAPVPLGWGAADGYQTDAWDSGLVLMGSRLYDSAVGRFLSPDPAGDGDNWYAYCGNDPLDYSDPTGLWIRNGKGGWDPQPGDDPTKPPDITESTDANGNTVVNTGTTRITGTPYQPAAVNILNDHDYEAVSAVCNGFTDFVGNLITGKWADKLQPHQEAGVGYIPPGGPFYRGGSSMTARPGIDVKIDKQTGLIGTKKGISLNTDPNDSFIKKWGGPFKVNSVPEGLTIIPAGRPGHFELAPSEPMTLDGYQALLDAVELAEHGL